MNTFNQERNYYALQTIRKERAAGFRALPGHHDLRRFLYLGISDTPAWIVAQANTLAQVHGWSPFVGLQIEYSLAQRDPERDLLPMARAFDLGVTAWSPLAGGILSGKYGKTTKSKPDTARYSGEGNPPDERKLRIGETVTKLADEIGRPASQVALNCSSNGGSA